MSTTRYNNTKFPKDEAFNYVPPCQPEEISEQQKRDAQERLEKLIERSKEQLDK